MTTNAMSMVEMTAELERLRELVTKAEQREDERQRMLRPIVGWIRMLTLFLALVAVSLMVIEQIYGFRGHMGALASQFVMFAALMGVMLSALTPLTGRSNGVTFWRKAAQQTAN